MYTVYDFVNSEISGKCMRMGWKVEVHQGKIALRYTMLNFDWTSLDYIGNDLWNMFLESASYENLRKRLDAAMEKKGRLYLDALDISSLKTLAQHFNVKVDIDTLVSKTIAKKSQKMKERHNTNECNSQENV